MTKQEFPRNDTGETFDTVVPPCRCCRTIIAQGHKIVTDHEKWLDKRSIYCLLITVMYQEGDACKAIHLPY